MEIHAFLVFIFIRFFSFNNNYSRPFLFAGLRIVVLIIHGKIIAVIFVHCGIGPSLFHSHSCAGARINTQQPASARLSQ
jgi:hypothetical protein